MTAALIAFNLAVFVAMVGGAALAKPFTWVAIWDRLLHTSSPILIRWGADYGPLTLAGQWWRLLTAVFLHIGVVHLLGNLWYLFNVGPIAESIWGRRTYLFLYFFSGLAGSVVSLWWNPLAVSAGASGALFGVTGALLVSLRWGRLPFPASAVRMAFISLAALVAVALFYGLTAQIDNAAHIGGLAGGLIAGIGLLLAKPRAAPEPSPAQSPPPSEVSGELSLTPVMAIFLAIVLAACGAGAWWARRYVVPMEHGRALLARNQAAAAIPELRKATRLGWGKRSSEAHRLLAEASMRRGDVGTAQVNLLMATELNPRDADSWSLLGLLYLGTRRPREASVALARAADLNPKSAGIRYNLGIAYIGSRQFDQAITTLKQITAETPNDADAWRALAYAYKSKGMEKESEAAMQRSSEWRSVPPAR